MAHDDAKRAAAAQSSVSSPVSDVPSLRSTPPGKTLDPKLQRVGNFSRHESKRFLIDKRRFA